MNEKLSRFIAATRAEFDYLIDEGLEIPEKGIVANSLYGVVGYFGKNVCISFSYNLRERCTDCYVGKVINGEKRVNRKKGGYWAPLLAYIRESRGISNPILKIERSTKLEFPELRQFKMILNEYGEMLLKDKDDAFTSVS